MELSGFCMALNMNSVAIPEGLRGDAGFSGLGWFRAIWGLKRLSYCGTPYNFMP